MAAKIAVLFPNAWDERQLSHPKYRDELELFYLGDDLFSFPGSLKLIGFDALKFVDRTVDFCKRHAVDGVMSSDEYIGAIVAAMAARELGLPGNDPGRIATAQHKYYSRVEQAKTVPEITPPHALLRLDDLDPDAVPLPYPFFTKPCKGTFSLFASKIASPEELREKLRFNLIERLVLNRVAKPFNDLLRATTDVEHDASAFVAEGLMKGEQVTVDGYVFEGDVSIMGITDSVMFEGTHTFERFEYPSRLPREVQERMIELTARLVKGFGFVNGQFNVELFYDRETGEVAVIEINPRLSYQFADLFEYVDGSNTYDVLIDLTLGREPSFRRGAGEFEVSASFVLRTFEGKKIARIPTEAEVDAVRRDYEESTIQIYGKAGTSTKGEMRASGSYRYAIVNVAAQHMLDLFAIHQDAIDKLPFAFD